MNFKSLPKESMSLTNSLFAVIDIETTGLSAGKEKITEIAILLHDGIQVVEEFSSLIHPERKIPYYITQLTGINDQMVAGAPKFYELARKIVEMTDNAIVVGHNVRFDYSFLRSEFQSLGYDFQRNTLDTLKLCRKLIPGLPGYSLAKICAALNIPHHQKHRALGDATATATLLSRLLALENGCGDNIPKVEAESFNHRLTASLPEAHGVYYLYDTDDKLIYVGKANNIKSRVLQHLNNNSTRKAGEMKQHIAHVDFELCGNELISLLLESDEIKKHKPLFNRKQKRASFTYGLFHFLNEDGYLCLKTGKIVSGSNPETSYSSAIEAREHLFFLTEQFELCQRLNGIYPGHSTCFHVQIGRCKGACCGREKPETYNERAYAALIQFRFEHPSFYLFDVGRSPEEVAVVKVENGVFRGFGFAPIELLNNRLTEADDFIRFYPDNRDVRQIIRLYLRKNKALKIVPFSSGKAE